MNVQNELLKKGIYYFVNIVPVVGYDLFMFMTDPF